MGRIHRARRRLHAAGDRLGCALGRRPLTLREGATGAPPDLVAARLGVGDRGRAGPEPDDEGGAAMTRWIAPLAAAVSLLLLFVGLIRAETDQATTAGVSMAFWGVTGLVLAGAAVVLTEYAAARRMPATRGPAVARRPEARAR
jgi:hypothetical protein